MTVTVVLNGTSSSGKTSLAKAIRAASPVPLQISGIDTFLALQPGSMFAPPGADAASDGFTWTATAVDGVECWNVVAGTGGEGLVRAVHQYWAASAGEGINQVIDHVLLSAAMASDLTARLAPYRPIYVGVRCPADVVEERERIRGDRLIGQGRGIASHVHDYLRYDVEVDTSTLGSDEAAQVILSAINARGLT